MKLPFSRPLLFAAAALGFVALAGCTAAPPPPSTTASSGATSRRQRQPVVLCVLKHEATRHQREVAEANARRVYFSQSQRRRAALRHGKRSRYIAVQTVRNTESGGEASCMVFDTATQKIVGNTVYDCDSVPREGTTAKFDSFNATYVGG